MFAYFVMTGLTLKKIFCFHNKLFCMYGTLKTRHSLASSVFQVLNTNSAVGGRSNVFYSHNYSGFSSVSVCFYMLLNMAENVKVEDKMRKRNIVGLLVSSLERSTLELLVLVSSFLLKLSVYRENKDEMVILYFVILFLA